MRRIAGVLLCLLNASCGCSVSTGGFHTTTIVGSGVPLVEVRSVAPFRRIEVSGAFHVAVNRGVAQGLEVRGDDNLVPLVSTEVEGDTLHVRWKPSSISVRCVKLPTVSVTVPDLAEADLSGTSRLELHDLRAGNLVVALSGASRLSASGEAGSLVLKASGASWSNTTAMRTRRVEAELSGASHASVHATESLTGEASGASTLVHFGSPSRVDVHLSGASKLEKGS